MLLTLLSLPLLAADRGWIPLSAIDQLESQPPPTEQEWREDLVDPGQLGLQLSMERQGPAGWQRVPLQSAICNGDVLRFRLRSTGPGHVELWNLGTSGRWHALVGPSAPWSAGPGPYPDLLLPSDGSGYEVTGPAGTELLLLALARDELSEPVRALMEELRSEGATASVPRVPVYRDLSPIATLQVHTAGEQVAAIELHHPARCPR